MTQARTTRRSASGSTRDARPARHSLPLGGRVKKVHQPIFCAGGALVALVGDRGTGQLSLAHYSVATGAAAGFDALGTDFFYTPQDVGTTLGAGNYRSFVFFMWFGFFGVSMTALAALQYVVAMPFNFAAWFLLVDFALVTVMAVMMNEPPASTCLEADICA